MSKLKCQINDKIKISNGKYLAVLILILTGFFFILDPKAKEASPLSGEEKHLANIRQLTFGGKNAEAYFSFDGKKLIFQATRDGFQCDQIFTMNDDGSSVHLVSTGRGQTTCAYFFPDGKRILYSSTHHRNPDCPPALPRGKRYGWNLFFK
jgi:dipeptidyl aminopeptidase/acylaminoacyl peptidase